MRYIQKRFMMALIVMDRNIKMIRATLYHGSDSSCKSMISFGYP